MSQTLVVKGAEYFSFFNVSNKSGRNFDYGASIKCILGDFLNLSSTRMKVLFDLGFDAGTHR
jgi:hypothetical protein